MPVEIIGEFGTPGAELEWLEAEGKLAIQHLKKICGDPPPEMDLEIVWQGHELGNYPVIGLVWEDPMRETPLNYIARCEAALTAYESGGQLPPGCSMPPVASDDDDEFDDAPLNPEVPRSRQSISTSSRPNASSPFRSGCARGGFAHPPRIHAKKPESSAGTHHIEKHVFLGCSTAQSIASNWRVSEQVNPNQEVVR